jgi:Transposase DDE domain group 1
MIARRCTVQPFVFLSIDGGSLFVDRGWPLGRAESLDNSDRVVLDMDSSESLVHGEQEGSAYNGHFESVCYHPLFLFNGHGDCLAEAAPGQCAQR